MKTLLAVCLATMYGLLLRIVFGFLDNLMGIMSVSFIILAPAIIGFLTVILLPKGQTRNRREAFFKPWLTSLAILIITILLEVEGTICWIMIYPLFSVLAGIGGMIAFSLKNRKTKSLDKKKSGQNNSLHISFVLLIPVVAGLIEGDRTQNKENFMISKKIVISASAKTVWNELININDIPVKENQFSFSTIMGFPKHLRTTLDTLAVGGRRKAVYEKGLYFDETIVKYEQENFLVLDIKTDPYNIPPKVMDEHIVIGGKHVDILQDIYSIEKLSDNSCSLTLSSAFYINTPFNWYAGIWAKYLMSDILRSEITLIKKRATGNR